MANLIIFLDRIIYLYLYFIVGACLLSWIPNINPDYPLFHFIFTAAGCYLLPPVMGFSIAPALVALVCASISTGLRKIYDKYYADKEPQVIVISPEELAQKLKEQNKKKEDNNDSL